MNKCECDNLVEKDYIILKEMSDNNFGLDYYSIEDYKKFLKNNELFVFKDENNIYGFVVAYIQSDKDFWKSMYIENTGNDQMVGVLRSVYFDLDKIYKNRVRIKPLFKIIEDKFKDIKVFYSPVWKSRKGMNSKLLVESFGFKPIMEIKNFWSNIPIYRDIPCPVCGLPCICSNVIYKKDMTNI